jgi:FMN phosphatase YigB (HAD superfamily)|tara:strand:+ start:6692 stop:7279 length:588 start_codon:yes stop_codon:yes gene_type:complete
MSLSEKVIVTDVDGVLLDWLYSFTNWMKKHGFEVVEGGEDSYDVSIRYGLGKVEKDRLVRMFNESAWIRKLPPLRDAIKYVRKLHEEHGYVFRVCSSLSNDYYAQHLRTKNLIEMFGPSVFESFEYLDTGADKDEALEKYRDSECWWIEDKPENADLGLSLGMESILVAHDFNKDYTGDAPRVKNWKQIYEIIAG